MSMELPIRPRRLRRTAALRALATETRLDPSCLVYPIFIQDTPIDEPIAALPGLTCFGLSIDANPAALCEHLRRVADGGVPAVALFPKIDPRLKTPDAEEAVNPDGLVPRALALIKEMLPDLALITDVALDPYSSVGHDGLVAHGQVQNDATVEVLCRQALVHAQAGADLVAPSDMMDGRVGAIRQTLDAHGQIDTGILSYAVKYASAFYGPFRGALDSAPVEDPNIPPDKKSYQMNPANAREAIREAQLDEQQGADLVMVKPAGAYLDVIQDVRRAVNVPVAAYQVSGEYLMIHAAAQTGHLDLDACMLESLTSIRRAGADVIFTYFAPRVAELLA